MSECPYCAEAIPAAVTKCPQCGELLGEARRVPPVPWQLRVAALLQLGLGGIAALAGPCVLAGVAMQAALRTGPQVALGPVIASGAMYGAIGAFFLITAFGAWRARRWVRPIMLSVAAPSLALGLLVFVGTCLMVPTTLQMTQGFMQAAPGNAPPPAGGLMTAIAVMTVGISFLLYVALPAVFVGLYRSPRLQPACDARDHPRWTDGVPLPILAAALWLALAAACAPFMLLYGVVVVFGAVLTGAPAAVAAVALSATFAVLARAVFRRRPWAWPALLAAVLVLGVSHVVTFTQIDMLDMYRAMHMPPRQLEVLERLDLSATTRATLGMGVAACALALGYVGYLRRYLRGPQVEGDGAV